MPFSILFGSLAFTKKYQVQGVFTTVMESVKSRLCADNFDEVMKHAVAMDLSPLKLFCMDFAKRTKSIKRKFQKSELSPESQFELQALWPAPCTKKARLRL